MLETHGVFHDPGTGHEREHCWLGWLKYAVGARLVNRRVAQVRRSDPRA